MTKADEIMLEIKGNVQAFMGGREKPANEVILFALYNCTRKILECLDEIEAKRA